MQIWKEKRKKHQKYKKMEPKVWAPLIALVEIIFLELLFSQCQKCKKADPLSYLTSYL